MRNEMETKVQREIVMRWRNTNELPWLPVKIGEQIKGATRKYPEHHHHHPDRRRWSYVTVQMQNYLNWFKCLGRAFALSPSPSRSHIGRCVWRWARHSRYRLLIELLAQLSTNTHTCSFTHPLALVRETERRRSETTAAAGRSWTVQQWACRRATLKMSLKLNGKHFFLYVDSDFRCVVYTFHSLHRSHADGDGAPMCIILHINKFTIQIFIKLILFFVL